MPTHGDPRIFRYHSDLLIGRKAMRGVPLEKRRSLSPDPDFRNAHGEGNPQAGFRCEGLQAPASGARRGDRGEKDGGE